MGDSRVGRVVRLGALLLLAGCTPACRGSGVPAHPDRGRDRPPVAAVTVEPSSGELPVGGTLSLTARVRDSAGAEITGRVVSWTSSASDVATVDAEGRVRGVAPGTATIRAASEGWSGAATLTVVPAAQPMAHATTDQGPTMRSRKGPTNCDEGSPQETTESSSPCTK
ncbi:Ig-like domain-containing protein [Gemmatimonadota bacterium Y43]|uniref:Ig-like domain-containing protein n=1 Tax=Gaopeijia maritima TaxID=3119007 RepID=UPI00327E3D44